MKTKQPPVAAFNQLFQENELPECSNCKTMDEVLKAVEFVLRSHRTKYLQIKLIRDVLDTAKR